MSVTEVFYPGSTTFKLFRCCRRFAGIDHYTVEVHAENDIGDAELQLIQLTNYIRSRTSTRGGFVDVFGIRFLAQHAFDAGDEGGWVELGAEDFVGAVGVDGDAPVADKGDELTVVQGFYFRAEALGLVKAFGSFDIDENEGERVGAEEREGFVGGTGGKHVVAGKAQDLVA